MVKGFGVHALGVLGWGFTYSSGVQGCRFTVLLRVPGLGCKVDAAIEILVSDGW